MIFEKKKNNNNFPTIRVCKKITIEYLCGVYIRALGVHSRIPHSVTQFLDEIMRKYSPIWLMQNEQLTDL